MLCTHVNLQDPLWAMESERMLEEKQELISRLIVQSQQAFFMAKVGETREQFTIHKFHDTRGIIFLLKTCCVNILPLKMM